MGFVAGGIGSGTITADNLSPDAATSVGLLANAPNTKKLWFYSFDGDTLDSTKWVSTVVAGTNTMTMTGFFGYMLSSTTATAGRSATLYGNAKMKPNEATTIIVEWQIKTTAQSAGSSYNFQLSASVPSVSCGANSLGLGYRITGAGDGWAFYTVDNAAAVEKDTGLTVDLTTTWHTVRFLIEGTGTSVKCYIDGVQIGTTHSTNLPVINTALYFGQFVGNGADATQNQIYMREFRIVTE